MALYISTGDGVVGYGAIYLYWRRCGRLPHCTVDLYWSGVEGYGVVYLYWIRCSKNRTVDLYWGRSSKIWCRRYLLGTVR